MEFLYPNFLWALFAVGIPVAIHLFNFRKYTTLLYSDVSLLRNVKQETKKQRNLKHLLVLLMRILAIIFLVLAFAQPYLPAHDQNTQQKVALFLDNSASMLAIDKGGENFNLAKLKAKVLVNSYGNQIKYRLYTHSRLPKHNTWLAKAEVLQEIDELDISDASQSFSKYLQNYKLDFGESDSRFYVISDFQKSNFNFTSADSNISVSLIPTPVAALNKNISVDSVWVYNPISVVGFEQKIYASIKNYGSEVAEDVSVNLNVNDKLSGAFTVSIDPKSSTQVEFKYTPQEMGALKCVIEIVGPAFYFDDKKRFSIRVSESKKVVSIYDQTPTPLLAKIYNDDLTELTSYKTSGLDLQRINQADLIVLDHLQNIPNSLLDVLSQQQKARKNILILPPKLFNIESYQRLSAVLKIAKYGHLNLTTTEISKVFYNDAYFSSSFGKKPKNISIAGVNAYYGLTQTASGFPLVNLKTGHPLAYRFTKNGANVVLLTSGLTPDFGAWYNSNLIYPLLYQAVLYNPGKSTIAFNANTLGTYSVHKNSASETPVKVWHNERAFIPRQENSGANVTVLLDEQFRNSGYFTLTENQDTLGVIAVNVP